MIIQNFDSLATTPARSDALKIAEAGYEAIRVETIMKNKLVCKDGVLSVNRVSYKLADYDHVGVIGFGKGSARACLELEKIIGSDNIAGGVVIDIEKANSKKILSFVGTHPLPSEQNVKATKKLIEFAQAATDRDLVIAVICGGGSSLLCDPANMSCTDSAQVSHHLLLSGASIGEMNTVRKHLSRIHGGFLAEHAQPATLLALVISDVPGNDLSMVASGPTLLDKTTLREAQTIATKYGLPNLPLIETPKKAGIFKTISTQLLASGLTALEAMQTKSKELGYETKVASRNMHGLATLLGIQMSSKLQPNHALLACGESQVVVRHPGKGGRNQDLALAALEHLPKNSAIISAASDGKDNIPVAGGIVDSEYAKTKAHQLGLHAAHAVAYNQSYETLKKINGIFTINRVCANVSDFVVAIQKETTK